MAELPELELLKQKLRRNILNKRINAMQMHNAKGELLTDGTGIEEASFKGKPITDLRRYGQYLFLELGGVNILAMHLGGELTAVLQRRSDDSGGEDQAAARAVLEIQVNGNQRLRLQGTQLGNRLRMLDEDSDLDFLTKLGPDALMVHGGGLSALGGALSRRRSALRNILLDDSFTPGIGGIWADEILYQARLRPDRTAPSLSNEERERFLEQIPKVLARAVRCQAKTNLLPKSFLTRHRQDNHCPGCGGALETLSLGGKNALFCPACQS